MLHIFSTFSSLNVLQLWINWEIDLGIFMNVIAVRNLPGSIEMAIAVRNAQCKMCQMPSAGGCPAPPPPQKGPHPHNSMDNDACNLSLEGGGGGSFHKEKD